MKQVHDFNIHVPREAVVTDDLTLGSIDFNSHITHLKSELSECDVRAGNVMILDPTFALTSKAQELAGVATQGCTLTAMLDPRDATAFTLVDELARMGFSGIKFHPYFQNLADHDFYAALGVCQYAASKGLWLALCCSYGTKRVFENHGAKLLGALAQAGVDMPIVALHSGGRLVLEVMSIALEAPNIYLDTSFSIPFWVGSSVEQDIAFAIRKVGADRCMFGSDRPYQPLKHSIDETIAFLHRHRFADNEIESIMMGTFKQLRER